MDEVPTPANHLVLPMGGSDDEEPYLATHLTEAELQQYGGVLMPYNVFGYVNKGEQLAGAEGRPEKTYRLIGMLIGRMVKKYGTEEARNILSGGEGITAEQQAYFEKLLGCERIRLAVGSAAQEVLGHERATEPLFLLREMRDVEAVRDAVLGAVQQMYDKANGGTTYVFAHGMQMSFWQALEFALPKDRRVTNGSAARFAPNPEQLYPLTEAAVIQHVVIPGGGRYMTHRGAEEGKDKWSMTPECLKEAIVGLDPRLGERWDVTRDLDGGAFYPRATSSGSATASDPYYLLREWLNGPEHIPHRVPGVPFIEGWGNSHLRGSGAGLKIGQVTDLARRHLNQELARYVRYGAPRQEVEARLMAEFPSSGPGLETSGDAQSERRVRAVLGGRANVNLLGRRPGEQGSGIGKYESLKEWAIEVLSGAEPRTLEVPRAFNIHDYLTLVRLLCEDVGRLSTERINDHNYLPIAP